jgi:2'-5' RNA ligase
LEWLVKGNAGTVALVVRLFVAINLPDNERRALWDSTSRLRGAGLPVRWAGGEGLHLTLKFLGESDDSLAARVSEALAAAVKPARPFEVGLGGFGAFPDQRRPRVLWVGVERHPALELLANDVERALAPFGFPSELRPFHPHVTLGRAERRARPSDFSDLPRLAGTVSYQGSMLVDRVDLMRSRPGPSGAVYSLLHSGTLEGRGV